MSTWQPAPLVLLAAAALVACKPSQLDHTRLEETIRKGLSAKGVELKSVSCPVDRPIKAGDTFDCTGIDADGEHLIFTVDQKDNAGNVGWKLDGMIINQKKIGDGIATKIHQGADVQCPSKVVIVKVNGSFTCNVQIEGKVHHVLLTVTNDKGDVSWKVVD